VRIQPKRDSRIAVSELCANGSDACAPVNQRRGNAMTERMEAGECNSERHKQRAQFLLLQVFNQRSLPPRAPRPEGPEETYWRVLNSWGLELPARELIDTLKFMRYRRNSLIHLSKVPSLSYQNLASQLGSILNAFWTIVKMEIDFGIPATTPLNERETLDFLKLLRVIIQRLDTHFATIIDERGLVQAEARRLC